MTRNSITIALEGPCAALATEDELRAVVEHTLQQEGVTASVMLTIVLVDNATIHDLNRRFLDHDEPTDILTFPFAAAADEASFILPAEPGAQPLGEIYISCEQATTQSAEWASTPTEEIRFLVVHGVLHLLGWDDATPIEREQMLARQTAILATLPTARRAQ